MAQLPFPSLQLFFDTTRAYRSQASAHEQRILVDYLVLLATPQAGDAYTFQDYDTMFKRAGLGHSEIYAMPNSKKRVTITRKS